MKINDEKLTAYALNELEGKEKAKVEEHLKENEEARRYVDGIRNTAELVTREFGEEPTPGLSTEQKEKIRAASSEHIQPEKKQAKVVWYIRPALAAAAVILVAAGLYRLNLMHRRSAVRRPQGFKVAANLDGERQDELGPVIYHGEKKRESAPPRPAAADVSYDAVEGALLAEAEPAYKRSLKTVDSSEVMAPEIETGTKKGFEDALALEDAGSISVIGGQDREKAGKFSPRPEDKKQTSFSVNGSIEILSRYQENAERNSVAKSGLGVGGGARHAGRSARIAEVRKPGGSGDDYRGDVYVVDQDGKLIPGVQYFPDSHAGETYDRIIDNPFFSAARRPLSTFSIDVDTASYANVRRFINQGSLPPRDAVRIEEMINYFSYDYPEPKRGQPFSVNVEIATCPWNTRHRLAKIGLKGKSVTRRKRPSANIVFLLDVSGSMSPANKLPLVKRSMKMLVEELEEKDRVAIAVYAGASGLVLPSTSCERKRTILAALGRLSAGGSTNGGAGIELAYSVATENFMEGGINRVILCTDGDFNVGTTDDNSLVRLIERKAKSGVFLSVLGFGMGNYKGSKMEKLADKGNGNYAYIDTFDEARKVLRDQLIGTLVTIAKDVKVQIEFNPDTVRAYRLIGYENRMLRKEDFNDDTKDAGEIGAGHTVTALYEIVPAGGGGSRPLVDPLRYQDRKAPVETDEIVRPRRKTVWNNETFFLKLRYKEPDGEVSRLISAPVTDKGRRFSRASKDFKFAAGVASFGMILRNSSYKGTTSYDAVLELAEDGLGSDRSGYRRGFIDLVRSARRMGR